MDYINILTDYFLMPAETAGSSFVFCLTLYFLNRILFLERHTEKRQKRIRQLFWILGIVTLIHLLITFVEANVISYIIANLENPAVTGKPWVILFRRKIRPFLRELELVLWMVEILGSYAILMYVTVTGRVKHKWLGVFSLVVLIGYRQMLYSVSNIPTYFLSKHSRFLAES